MNSRLLVRQPEKVDIESDRYGKRWIGLGIVVVAGIAVSAMSQRQASADVYPDEGPSEVFGETMMQEPTPCAPCECRDCESGTWLAKFVHHLDNLAENPREIRDVLNRSYAETRLTPSSVSDTGDWGICQINRRSWPDVDTSRLLDDPEYAAVECLRVYRVYFKACGSRWQECYRKGKRGAR
jgi:hypothetical protein